MKSRVRPWTTTAQLAGLVRECLQQGGAVEIDGVGCFQPRGRGRFAFQPEMRTKVFLAYVQEDRDAVDRLHDDLAARGFDPWVDRKKLLAGQNWPRAIERAIAISDFVIPCFSPRSLSKRGMFQAELRFALDCAARMPLEDVFLVPVRLEHCTVPERIAREIQYVDLFPDWGKGVARVSSAMRRRSAKASRPLASS